MRRGALFVAAAACAAAATSTAAAATPSCAKTIVKTHNRAVFGHFATLAAANKLKRHARAQGFQGLKIENKGCGNYELEIDGADSEKDRSSFAKEAVRAGFQVTFEQTGPPMQPPPGQAVGIFARKRTVSEANALMWRLAAANFRYIDLVPDGTTWLVVMPQVPVEHALSIAKEVASAGFHIQFRKG
jgi:hypothetical protein